jgi:hypothetical protein
MDIKDGHTIDRQITMPRVLLPGSCCRPSGPELLKSFLRLVRVDRTNKLLAAILQRNAEKKPNFFRHTRSPPWSIFSGTARSIFGCAKFFYFTTICLEKIW